MSGEKKTDDWRKVVGMRNAYVFFTVQWLNSNYTREIQAAKGLPFSLKEGAMLSGAAWRELSEEDKKVFIQLEADDAERFKKEYKQKYGYDAPESRRWDHCSRECWLHLGCVKCKRSSKEEEEEKEIEEEDWSSEQEEEEEEEIED